MRTAIPTIASDYAWLADCKCDGMLELIAVGVSVTMSVSGLALLLLYAALRATRAWRWQRIALRHPVNRHGATVLPPPSRRKRHWTPEARALRWSGAPMLSDWRLDYAQPIPPNQALIDTLPSNGLPEIDIDLSDTIPCPPKEF